MRVAAGVSRLNSWSICARGRRCRVLRLRRRIMSRQDIGISRSVRRRLGISIRPWLGLIRCCARRSSPAWGGRNALLRLLRRDICWWRERNTRCRAGRNRSRAISLDCFRGIILLPLEHCQKLFSAAGPCRYPSGKKRYKHDDKDYGNERPLAPLRSDVRTAEIVCGLFADIRRLAETPLEDRSRQVQQLSCFRSSTI